MITNRVNCCYECSRRMLGCHSKCSDYAEFRKEINRINEKKEMFRKAESLRFKISYVKDVVI
ncbi:hypothetical protein [Peptoniphilus timonensis]|uniref:hypothetical protein n=1 Tax=Peptoniphilus timonensis TaxID=1268254 RepID=UPI0002F7A1A3|nr:hypothetical protein [Peptoniphilus timonensis]